MFKSNYLNKIAYLYWENGSTKDAIEYFEQSIKLNAKIGNQNAVQAIHTNLGLIYSEASDYQSSVIHFKESLEINKKVNKKMNKRVIKLRAICWADRGSLCLSSV